MAGTVLLLGTFDTKGHEYAFVRDRLLDLGVAVLLVDAGIDDPVGVQPDVARDAVAEAGGARIEELASAGDRGAAVEAMARGAAGVVRRLFDEGRFDGILALGGSGGSSIADGGDAGSAGRRPEADGLDDGGRRHAAVRRRRRT